jgi:heat shock protein HslJ
MNQAFRTILIALLILALAACSPSAETNDLDGTEWILTWLNGGSLLSGTNVTLSFVEGQATGFAGCNAYHGPYTASRGALQVAQLAVTAMGCFRPTGVMQQEQLYTDKLQSAAAYRIANESLEISGRAGATVLVFTRKERFAMNPHDLLNTRWQLVSVNGEKPLAGSTMTLEFVNESQVSGHAGSRDYWATYNAKGDAIKFPSSGMLGEVCPSDASLEQKGNYTTMLSWTTNYRLAEDRLELSTARGEVLIYVPLGSSSPAP